MDKKKPEHFVMEWEPIFGVHIDFADGSNPVDYYNLNLARTLDVLKEWSENWILTPDRDCKLNSSVWRWYARIRKKEDPNLLDAADEDDDEEDDGVEPILEDTLNKED